MKLFLSWSGERSQLLAQSISDWLPLVLHYVQPWMSKSEIAAGERWQQVIASQLEATNFGILCVTPENLNSDWVLFEAGALAKSLQDAKVIPLLFRLEYTEISGSPLSQFQAKKTDESGFREVVNSINQSSSSPVPDERLNPLFEALWPSLKEKIAAIPTEQVEFHKRPQDEILEDLVSAVRAIDSRLRDIERLSEDTVFSAKKRRSRFHPEMIDELMFRMSEEALDPATALIIFAGVIRDDFPGLYELFVDASREIRGSDDKSLQRILERLRRTVHAFTHTRLMREQILTKDGHRWAMELPLILDHLLYDCERLLTQDKEQEDKVEIKAETRDDVTGT